MNEKYEKIRYLSIKVGNLNICLPSLEKNLKTYIYTFAVFKGLRSVNVKKYRLLLLLTSDYG